MKNANSTLTAAIALALGTAVWGQAGAAEDQLIDVASGALIDEGQAIMESGNPVYGKFEIAMAKSKAGPKKKTR